MDEERAIQLYVKHRDPVGFEFLVQKYRREAFSHAVALRLFSERDRVFGILRPSRSGDSEQQKLPSP